MMKKLSQKDMKRLTGGNGLPFAPRGSGMDPNG